ncbi:MAG: carbonic anhydrase [Candidatus Sericytochromatia bacterium]|nr:carbonic anhydrase [Candidatus Sericytochromatia bacterium]
MEKLIRGVHTFQQEVFSTQQDLFSRLARHQAPETLFITCADSRIVPNMLTMTDPGELFILRNAGNIVPPHGAARGGEGATVEYAVSALGVKDIIVCGHSQCGAMKGLLNPKSTESLPAVHDWLGHAAATRRIVEENYADVVDEEQRLKACIKENVLVQLENLRTLPSVAARLARGDLHLHAWVYEIETGQVFAYNPGDRLFHPLSLEVPTIREPRAAGRVI